MTIEERVDADVRRGDLGLARQRLMAHARSAGYSPERLHRLAEVCFRMQDLHAAGRYWLLSESEGPEVELAVREFVRRSGRTPASVVSQLPPFARLTKLDHYPPRVRRRLVELGLQEEIVRPVVDSRGSHGGSKIVGILVSAVLLTVLIGLLIVFIAGVRSLLGF